MGIAVDVRTAHRGRMGAHRPVYAQIACQPGKSVPRRQVELGDEPGNVGVVAREGATVGDNIR